MGCWTFIQQLDTYNSLLLWRFFFPITSCRSLLKPTFLEQNTSHSSHNFWTYTLEQLSGKEINHAHILKPHNQVYTLTLMWFFQISFILFLCILKNWLLRGRLIGPACVKVSFLFENRFIGTGRGTGVDPTDH